MIQRNQNKRQSEVPDEKLKESIQIVISIEDLTSHLMISNIAAAKPVSIEYLIKRLSAELE
jgi:hypothetical protein